MVFLSIGEHLIVVDSFFRMFKREWICAAFPYLAFQDPQSHVRRPAIFRSPQHCKELDGGAMHIKSMFNLLELIC